MGYDTFLHQNISSFSNQSEIVQINEVTGQLETHEHYDHPYDTAIWMPRWITSPVVGSQVINEDIHGRSLIHSFLEECYNNKMGVFRNFEMAPMGMIESDHPTTSFFATVRSMKEGEAVSYLGDPMARLYLPVYESFHPNSTVVAILSSLIHWRSYLRKLLAPHISGIDVVLDSGSCNGTYTYRIIGTEAYNVGEGDLHDRKYTSYGETRSIDALHELSDGTYTPIVLSQVGCLYQLTVYPSQVRAKVVKFFP
jgi:hypothetical protein